MQASGTALMQRNASIALDRITGMTVTELGEKYGVHASTISRSLNDETAKQIIEYAQRSYIAHAPQVAQKFMALCESDDEKISTANIKEYHKITGIAPAHTQSVFIQQIHQTNNVNVLAPEIQALLTQANGPQEEVIDLDMPDCACEMLNNDGLD